MRPGCCWQLREAERPGSEIYGGWGSRLRPVWDAVGGRVREALGSQLRRGAVGGGVRARGVGGQGVAAAAGLTSRIDA